MARWRNSMGDELRARSPTLCPPNLEDGLWGWALRGWQGWLLRG